MASVGTFFNNFLSIFLLLLLHLGCFYITTKDRQHRTKVSPQSPSGISPSHFKPRKAISFIKYLFSRKPCPKNHPTSPKLTSARSSQLLIVSMVLHPLETHLSDPAPCQKPSASCQESDVSADNPFFPLRNDIFPCTACGEIFNKPLLLEQHQAIKHALTELVDGDSGKNIIRIIFKTGWTSDNKFPEIHRILKIHNSPKILSRFEEYRELVKARAARNGTVRRRDERCIADGNELLRFSCSTFMCDLGLNGDSCSLCNQQYCTVCGIIKSGFSSKMDGISTLSTSWRAHVSIPEDIEEEFKFMNVKRAMLVCRVVAGRVGCESDDVDKEDGGFDSVVGGGDSGAQSRIDDDDELLVFNPRAVLPCFVIVYTA